MAIVLRSKAWGMADTPRRDGRSRREILRLKLRAGKSAG